jgi:hypothetical protein
MQINEFSFDRLRKQSLHLISDNYAENNLRKHAKYREPMDRFGERLNLAVIIITSSVGVVPHSLLAL